MISYENYIDRVIQAHSWENLPNKPYKYATKTPSTLPGNCLDVIFKKSCPDKGTLAAYKLELEAGYVYRALLGEMMYAYVTCRPDIGYTITTMSKFSTKTSAKHYVLLRGIAKYLRHTKD